MGNRINKLKNVYHNLFANGFDWLMPDDNFDLLKGLKTKKLVGMMQYQ